MDAVDAPRGRTVASTVLRVVGGPAALAGLGGVGAILLGLPCLATAGQATRWLMAALILGVGGLLAVTRGSRGLVGRLVVLLLVGAVVTPFAARLADEWERGKRARTVGDLKALQTRLIHHRLRTGRWPGQTGSWNSVMAELGVKRELSVEDGWGGSLIYELDRDAMIVRAPCRCGRLDAPSWRDYDHGYTTDLRSDLMLVNDDFARFPWVSTVRNTPAARRPPPR